MKMKLNMENLEYWSKLNQMVLNPNKYEYTCLVSKRTSDDVFEHNVIIFGNTNKEKEQLGVIKNNNLNFNGHI